MTTHQSLRPTPDPGGRAAGAHPLSAIESRLKQSLRASQPIDQRGTTVYPNGRARRPPIIDEVHNLSGATPEKPATVQLEAHTPTQAELDDLFRPLDHNERPAAGDDS